MLFNKTRTLNGSGRVYLTSGLASLGCLPSLFLLSCLSCGSLLSSLPFLWGSCLFSPASPSPTPQTRNALLVSINELYWNVPGIALGSFKAPSTVISFQTKTEPFENSLQSGAIWKRCFLVWTGENAALWKRLRHQNGHDRAQDHSTVRIQNGRDATMWLQFRANFAGRYIKMRMRRVYLSVRTEGLKAFSKRIRRCSVDRQKRFENDKCGRKSFWKRSKTAPFSFENGLVWTGPKKTTTATGTLLNKRINEQNNSCARAL